MKKAKDGQADRTEIADRLRGRIIRGRQAGTIRSGDRLPPSREMALEFGVDHRIVLDAYRALADEGVIEMRARGGVYVGGKEGEGFLPQPAVGWLSDLLLQGINREIPIVDLDDWIRRAVETIRLRVLLVQNTPDQMVGLCGELRDYYGVEATGYAVDALADRHDAPAEFRFADLVITTPAFEAIVRRFAEIAGKRVIVIEVRPDLIGGEWRLLLKQPVYVVVRDERFLDMLEEFFTGTPGAHNLNVLVLGRDSLDVIPEGAAVYLTRGAREQLGDAGVRGRILPTPRFLSSESAKELIAFIVEANFRALAAVWKGS